ncbi:MAG: homoserine dehydrogenase [Candidatus Sumerlaeota bacterium]|nr:homoserine dehydrogenase [Candidatus Sumerlaeota bacterium]
MSKPLQIGLVGFGNIGSGVVRHLAEYGETINGRLPRPLKLKTICDVDLETDRGVSTQGITLTSNYLDIIGDPEIEVVIELIGGTKIANTIVTEALKAGKHVVTANKALIATYGGDLFRTAEEGGAHLLFEASVGAGIPLIRSLQAGLQPNKFNVLHGILNGTCNYILSAMEERRGVEFKTVLEEAMRLGYAEPDPTLDIEGVDTGHKIAVLGSLIFGQDLRIDDVDLMGITRLSPTEVDFAAAHGQTIKLLATASRDENGTPRLSVWPTLVPLDHPIGRVRGVTNTLWVDAEPVGPVMMTGAGAGQGSTSSGVLSDVCLVAQAGDVETLRRLNPLTTASGAARAKQVPVQHPLRYLRVEAEDKTAVRKALADLKVLGEDVRGVSFVAPVQSEEERATMLAKIQAAGIAANSICELRVGLQDPATVLGKEG